MKAYYDKLRGLGCNATRALIGAKMLSQTLAVYTPDILSEVANALNRGWSEHMCRTFIAGGYKW